MTYNRKTVNYSLQQKIVKLERLLMSIHSSVDNDWIKREIQEMLLEGKRKPRNHFGQQYAGG